MIGTKTRRSDRFLEALGDQPVVIVTHDNPDPDAIAAGWALLVLIRKVRELPVRLIGRGAIVRAENVHMLRLLNPPLELTDELPEGDASVVLVDCLPTGSNHLLNESPVRPVAVIDHHESTEHFRIRHRDVRPRAAATALIAAGYLREQAIDPGRELATAILYAFRTEVRGHGLRLTRSDRGNLVWLNGLADYAKLAEIENAPLTREYFSDLLLALQCTFLYQRSAVCFLPRASGAEIVGEVADLLVRCRGIHKVLCGAQVGDDLIFSARTTAGGGDSVALLEATLAEIGRWGGHRQRAGGRIRGLSAVGIPPESLFETLKERWLRACGETDRRPERLAPLLSDLEHLPE